MMQHCHESSSTCSGNLQDHRASCIGPTDTALLWTTERPASGRRTPLCSGPQSVLHRADGHRSALDHRASCIRPTDTALLWTTERPASGRRTPLCSGPQSVLHQADGHRSALDPRASCIRPTDTALLWTTERPASGRRTPLCSGLQGPSALVKTAQSTTGAALPPTQDIYNKRSLRKAMTSSEAPPTCHGLFTT
ncbi:uncharacterized protein LOC144538172 [Centroberyx gerrardi]